MVLLFVIILLIAASNIALSVAITKASMMAFWILVGLDSLVVILCVIGIIAMLRVADDIERNEW